MPPMKFESASRIEIMLSNDGVLVELWFTRDFRVNGYPIRKVLIEVPDQEVEGWAEKLEQAAKDLRSQVRII